MNRLRQLYSEEVIGGIKIALTAFIDNPQHLVPLCLFIRQYLINLAQLLTGSVARLGRLGARNLNAGAVCLRELD